MNNTIAVHESQNSEKVVKFIDQDILIEEISNLIENGDLWGLWYDDSGRMVAEDKSGDVYENVEKVIN